jgi:PEP-CTERM motif-containing protein
MRNRAFRTIATILSLLLVTSMPVEAAPNTFNEVIQVLGSYQNARQSPQLVLQGFSLGTKEGNADLSNNADNSLLAGVLLAPSQQQGVDVLDQSDVEGSICDCGEILVAGAGGFPKWPLLFLAGIPLIFIHHGDCEVCSSSNPLPIPPPTFTPTSTPPSIPEPATLLLFGSGLAAFAAGMRRRRASASLKKEVEEGDKD